MRFIEQIRRMPNDHKAAIGILTVGTAVFFNLFDQPDDSIVVSGVKAFTAMLSATELHIDCILALSLAKGIHDVLQNRNVQRVLSLSANSASMARA